MCSSCQGALPSNSALSFGSFFISSAVKAALGLDLELFCCRLADEELPRLDPLLLGFGSALAAGLCPSLLAAVLLVDFELDFEDELWVPFFHQSPPDSDGCSGSLIMTLLVDEDCCWVRSTGLALPLAALMTAVDITDIAAKVA